MAEKWRQRPLKSARRCLDGAEIWALLPMKVHGLVMQWSARKVDQLVLQCNICWPQGEAWRPAEAGGPIGAALGTMSKCVSLLRRGALKSIGAIAMPRWSSLGRCAFMACDMGRCAVYRFSRWLSGCDHHLMFRPI
jgi:hypothetical protein